MARSRRPWIVWVIVLTLVCCAAAILLLVFPPCRHQSTEEWLAEVRSYNRDEVVVGEINVSEILLSPDPASVPEIIAELERLSGSLNSPNHRDDTKALIGALAVCGGSEAASYLAKVYEAMVVDRHIEPSPPFELPEHNEQYGLEDKEFPGWREASALSDGIRYTAYVGAGPASGTDIFIGIDAERDGEIETTFPTGLTDYVIDTAHSMRDLLPKQPLGLSVVDDSISITHHEGVEPSRANRWKSDNRVVTSTLTIAELLQDSDHDGLTDICETCLLTNPHRKDTDGDGLKDSEDPHPQVDASKMDRLERGVFRALSYFYADSMRLDGPAPTTPYQAVRLYLEPPLEVAWTEGPYVYGIVIPVERAESGPMPNPGVLSKQEILDYDPCAAGLRSSQRAGGRNCRDAFGYVSEERIAYVMHLTMWYSGHLVVLVDVEGELYPASVIRTWIS